MWALLEQYCHSIKTLTNLSGMPAPCHHLQQTLGNEGEPLGLGEKWAKPGSAGGR